MRVQNLALSRDLFELSQKLVGIGTLSLGLTGCSALNSGLGLGTLSGSDQEQAIRPLSAVEATADFDAMVTTVKSLYGPYEYKENRFGYKLDAEAARIRSEIASATDENARIGKLYEFLRLLEDGHVSLSSNLRETRFIPIFVTWIENKTIVEDVNPALARNGIERGDEIVSVDGKTPEDILKVALKYSWFGNPISDKMLVYRTFYRVNHMPEIFPQMGMAQITFRKPNGDVRLAQVPWTRSALTTRSGIEPQIASANSISERLAPAKADERESILSLLTLNSVHNRRTLSTAVQDLNDAKLLAQSAGQGTDSIAADQSLGIAAMGNGAPHFWSAPIQAGYQVARVYPDLGIARAAYMLWVQDLARSREMTLPASFSPPTEFPAVFAALYKFAGKTVLFVRQPSYSTADSIANLAVYTALMHQFQPLADVLVVDQTHNPGGSATYVENFARLFMPKGGTGFVQFLNTDRRWYSEILEFAESLTGALPNSLQPQYLRAVAAGLETDAKNNLRLGKTPFSFSLNPILKAAPGVTWQKPFLVLIDELCASGGDAFPMLLRDNKLGATLGVRTAGLGGSVEPVLELPYLRSGLNLTRGLFTTFQASGQYDPSTFVENNGVNPTVEIKHTVGDFRQGFVRYFNMVSTAAAILAGATPAQMPPGMQQLAPSTAAAGAQNQQNGSSANSQSGNSAPTPAPAQPAAPTSREGVKTIRI